MGQSDCILLAMCVVLFVLNLYLLYEVGGVSLCGSTACCGTSETFTGGSSGTTDSSGNCGYNHRSTWLSESEGDHCGNSLRKPWLYSL